MLALVAAAAAFIGVCAIFAWMSNTFTNPAEARLSRMSHREVRTSLEAPFANRVFVPVLDGVVRGFVKILPHSLVARTNQQLLAAGSPMSPPAFYTTVLVCALFFPAAAIFLLASATGGASFLVIFLALWIAVVGLLLPFVWLRRRVRLRKTAILKSLADAFDTITVCVEAGLGLDASLRQVSTRMRGPLAEEIGFTLRQVGMGRARREALEDLAVRADVPEVTTFVNAVIQAEQLGTSLGRVLRSQSQSLRIRRRQRAEEIARRAPVKMVFPLVAFLMPTFFIVTIGPVAIHFVEYLKG